MGKNKKRTQLNDEQQAAAFCEENAVVAAGAGSGKTMVLANRFAWLLTEKGYNVNEILTLTFTKKAAAQMFSRIHSLLTEIAEGEDKTKAARARKALDNFVHSRIQTLDSYSSSIVKQYAPRYGISPDFTIDEGRCRQIAMEESLPFLITHRHHPAIERIYSESRPNEIAGGIFADILLNHCRIDKPRDFSADVKTQFGIVCIEWKKQINIFVDLLSGTENMISENNDMLPALAPLLKKHKKTAVPQAEEIRQYFEYLLNLPVESCIEKSESHSLQKQMMMFLHFLSEICSIDLRKGKPRDNTAKENIKEIRAIFGRLSSLAVSCLQAGLIISIMSLLAQLQEQFLERKRLEGVLTFNDVANLSKTILLEQLDIRQSEKESFKAVMIDEFQDNNDLQKDLLFLLAEKQEVLNNGIPGAHDLTPGKLFFVGDEKQSVYLFRGADVSVFRKLKDELKSADLPLKTNYRSVPALIGAFNAIFGGSDFDPKGKNPLSAAPSVFAPSNDENPLPLYEAQYTPLTAGIKGEGKLSVCILNKNAKDGAENEETLLQSNENEAFFTAQKIHKLINEQNYEPDDIAILFRTRNPQYYFEKHLRLLGIPYACEDINDFFYAGPVNDIMSVLRLAAHPLDSASYAEMLRSPFAGLSLAGTAVCLSVFNNSENPAVFNDEPLNLLDETDREKYIYGQNIYFSICKKAATESISSLVSELWYKEGYRYETEWNPAASVYGELYDYLFHLAVLADCANEGLASFTDAMRDLRDSDERLTDIEIPLERPNAVHLMTIHKSKGLEFPVVFLCCCGNTSRPDSSKKVYFSDNTGVVFSPPLPDACSTIGGIRKNFLWEQSIEEKKLKRTAELRRLLYVGMTRAEKELYLTGSLKIKDIADSGDISDTIKNYIEEKCEEKENVIPGDSILNNDTFFGLFLPSIVSRISQGFINIEEIPVYTEEDIKEQESNPKHLSGKHLPNTREGLSKYIKKTEPLYKKAKKIKTPELLNNHITPVSLKDKSAHHTEENSTQTDSVGRGLIISREFSGVNADDVFEKVDSLLAKFSEKEDESSEKFNSGSFGTIAHICVDALLSGKEPVFPPQLSGSISPDQFDMLFAAGKELASRFVLSPLGKIAKIAKLRENEFSFRSFLKNSEGKEVFISGTIDLFFEDLSSFHVVDFKTDNKETPVEHTAQMACYYSAVSSLFAVPAKKECRAWIYYLRTGHAVEMTDKVKHFNLENRAFI